MRLVVTQPPATLVEPPVLRRRIAYPLALHPQRQRPSELATRPQTPFLCCLPLSSETSLCSSPSLESILKHAATFATFPSYPHPAATPQTARAPR